MSGQDIPDYVGDDLARYKPACLVANPVALVLAHIQDYFYDLAKTDPSPAILWDALRTRLQDRAVLAGAGVSEEEGLVAASVVDQLSREFPPSVANLMREAFVVAYEGERPFNLATGAPPEGEVDEFEATRRVRVSIDYDDNGVSMVVRHATEHADWYRAPRPIP